MQVIYKNENERDGGRRTDLVDAIIYTERVGRYLEGECFGRFGDSRFRI